jgi:predicted DNA-binding transcriptional regulator AlpA
MKEEIKNWFELLNMNDYAKYRGVTRQTIYNWLEKGKDKDGQPLPIVELGGKKLFKVKEVVND